MNCVNTGTRDEQKKNVMEKEMQSETPGDRLT